MTEAVRRAAIWPIAKGVVGCITGLVGDHSLNGSAAAVQNFNLDKGRYTVCVQNAGVSLDGGGGGGGSRTLGLKPENLVLPPETAVLVVGLEGSPELNGGNGVILSFDAEKGRYSVRVDRPHRPKPLGLKPANCRATGPPPDPSTRPAGRPTPPHLRSRHGPPGTGPPLPERGEPVARVPRSAKCRLCQTRTSGAGGDTDLVRSCACRGEERGYVHINCLVEEASKATELEVWVTCRHCRERYSGRVLHRMGQALWILAEGEPDDSAYRCSAAMVRPLPPALGKSHYARVFGLNCTYTATSAQLHAFCDRGAFPRVSVHLYARRCMRAGCAQSGSSSWQCGCFAARAPSCCRREAQTTRSLRFFPRTHICTCFLSHAWLAYVCSCCARLVTTRAFG